MNYVFLCVNCFSDLEGRTVCGQCRWDQNALWHASLALPPRTVLKGCYLIGRVLGQGSFGITYVALSVETNRKLAIKEYLPSEFASRSRVGNTVAAHSQENARYFTMGLTRFAEEAESLAKIDHQSIVGVHDYFEENGTGYLVMDYLGDLTLAKYLDRENGKLQYETALNVLLPVMDGLREIHAHGLLHRDVSPDNICITPELQVKLIDFGAARFAIGEQHPKSLTIIIKDGYAPIEQYYTRGVQGPWTDIYSIGATLYRTITGHLPPAAPERQLKDNLVPPRRLGVDLARPAENALLRALAVKAEGRFHTIAEMQQALHRTTSAQDSPTIWHRFIFVGVCLLVLICLIAAVLFARNGQTIWGLAIGVLGVVFAIGASRLFPRSHGT
jgi:serine/threonine protein kinase